MYALAWRPEVGVRDPPLSPSILYIEAGISNLSTELADAANVALHLLVQWETPRLPVHSWTLAFCNPVLVQKVLPTEPFH